MATTGPVTSSIALCVASLGPSPSARCRSVFSTTTIASSTTIPIASTSPNRVSVLIVNPSMAMTAKVPITATGTASVGISVARQFWRKMKTTRKTSRIASKRVFTTSSTETSMKVVVS
jgi:hypothetical protein